MRIATKPKPGYSGRGSGVDLFPFFLFFFVFLTTRPLWGVPESSNHTRPLPTSFEAAGLPQTRRHRDNTLGHIIVIGNLAIPQPKPVASHELCVLHPGLKRKKTRKRRMKKKHSIPRPDCFLVCLSCLSVSPPLLLV